MWESTPIGTIVNCKGGYQTLESGGGGGVGVYVFGFFCVSFLIVCFVSYFMFSITVLPHSPGVVYYHLLFPNNLSNWLLVL